MEESVRLRVASVGFWVASLALILVVVALYLVPISFWIIDQLQSEQGAASASRLYFSLVVDTVFLSLLSGVTAVFFGSVAACLYAFSGSFVQRLLAILMTVPLLIGFLARNYSWLGLLSYMSGNRGGSGLISFIGNSALYNELGVVMVMGTVFIPFSFFVVQQGFSNVRVEFFEAARTLGVSDAKAFLVVTIPLVRRSIFMALGLSFLLAMGYFITPRMIGGGAHDFLGNGVLKLLNQLGDNRGASILGLYLFLTALFPMLALVWYSIRRRTLIMGQ